MHDIDRVLQILDEASELVVYSRQLEQKSRELEAATTRTSSRQRAPQGARQVEGRFHRHGEPRGRTPLTSIRSFSEILRDNPDLDQEQRQEFVSIIVKESERLSRLINDILDLAKMEAGTSEWHMGIRPTGGDRAGARRHRGPVRQGAPHLARDQDRRGFSAIRADADRLTQVIVNLISNAVKFCAQTDGRIELEAWQDADFLRVDVKDNGIGIAKADQQRIFERFHRPAIPSRTSLRAQGLACRFPGRFCSDSAAKSGSRASRARERRSPSVFRSLDRLRRRR